MAAETVSSMWVGKPLSIYEKLCLKSFPDIGVPMQLYCYDAKLEVPDGVVVRDAREVLPEVEIFENKKYPGTYSFFANLFRYQLLSKEQTLWVDADVLCLSAKIPHTDYVFGFESANLINNGVLGAPMDSTLIQELISQANAFDKDKIIWGQTGPKLLNRIAGELDLVKHASEVKEFYPLHYREVWKLFDPDSFDEVVSRVSDSTFLHLWNEYLRRAPKDVKGSTPPKNSYLGRKLIEHEIDTSRLSEMESSWARETWQHVLNPKVSFGQKVVNKIAWEISKLRSGDTPT